jgi:ATP-dependent Clp protease adapter protein ClpS
MSQFHTNQPEIPHLPKQPAQEPPLPAKRCRPLPLFKVILLSDDTSDLMHVVRSVMELTRFPRAEATHKMWEAHHNGRSVLLKTYLERGELFIEQFASRGLLVILEPA